MNNDTSLFRWSPRTPASTALGGGLGLALLLCLSFQGAALARTYSATDPANYLSIGASPPRAPVDIKYSLSMPTALTAEEQRKTRYYLYPSGKVQEVPVSGGREIHPYRSHASRDLFQAGHAVQNWHSMGGRFGINVSGELICDGDRNVEVRLRRHCARQVTKAQLFTTHYRNDSNAPRGVPIAMQLRADKKGFTGPASFWYDLDVHLPLLPVVSIGKDSLSTATPRLGEALMVNGGVLLRGTNRQREGTIAFRNGIFTGYDGTQWLRLDSDPSFVWLAGPGADSMHKEYSEDIDVGGEDGKVIFGKTDGVADSYLVNSLHAPLSGWSASKSDYLSDDSGTSGGLSVVTDGHPRLTIKGNGNTYIHKALSVASGALAEGTVLTVAGATHIGPADLNPARIADYTGSIQKHLLWVQKGIFSEDFSFSQVSQWSDHVFEEGYELMPLQDLESHIESAGHLPGVPSEAEVMAEGYSIAEINRILLEKVEELTLHAIAQQEAIEEYDRLLLEGEEVLHRLQAEFTRQDQALTRLSEQAMERDAHGLGSRLAAVTRAMVSAE